MLDGGPWTGRRTRTLGTQGLILVLAIGLEEVTTVANAGVA